MAQLTTQQSSVLAKDFSGLQPYYLMLTFWGEKYRQYFYSLCLPSLLSPNNVPVLQQVRGSKLIIATTENDWNALKGMPLFQLLSKYIEPYFINIGYPPPHVPIQLHMSKGHILAARKAYEDGAYAGFLAPDLIVSDGLVKFCMTQAALGKKVVLAQALRFAMEPLVETLQKQGFMKLDEPIVLPPRYAGSLATKALHSEIRRYEFGSPYFRNYPLWCYWRVPGRDCLVMHTVSWALLLGSYKELAKYHDNLLQSNTIDSFYLYQNFSRFRDTGEMHLITDSDEGLFISLTPEAELSYPLTTRRSTYSQRLTDMQRLLASEVLDPFRRWAYQVPTFIHGDDLDGQAVRVAGESVAVTTTAVALAVASKYTATTTIEEKLIWGVSVGSKEIKDIFRAIVGPLIVPLLGRLPRFILLLVLRAVPRPFVRSVVYRLTHSKAGCQFWEKEKIHGKLARSRMR